MTDTWKLYQGNTFLGSMTLTDNDNFWIYCEFTPTSAFEQFRSLFVEEQRLLEAFETSSDPDKAINMWEASYSKIRGLGLSLQYMDGEFDDKNTILLHILDNEAWFWPFDRPWCGGPVGSSDPDAKSV